MASLQYDRWAFFGQVDYVVLDSFDTPPNVDMTLDTYIATLGVGRIFYGKKDRSYQLMVGVRQTGMDAKVDTPAGSRKSSPDVVDYLLIFPPDIPLSEHWTFNPLMSAGTGDSEYQWELWPQCQYGFSDRWVGRIGYRNLHYKLDQKDNTDVNLDFRGVMLGFGVTW